MKMAVFSNPAVLSPLLLSTPSLSSSYPGFLQLYSPPLRSCSKNIFRGRCSSHTSSSMDKHGGKFMEFPYVSASHRALMLDLLSAVESRLEDQLLPCTLPPDVQYYENQASTARGSLYIRRGFDSSPVTSPSLSVSSILVSGI